MSPDPSLTSFRTSFQYKLFLVFTLLTLLIFSLLCTLYIVTQINEKRHATLQRLQLQTHNFAESVRLPLYAENITLLRQLAEQAVQAPEILAVVITSPDGRVLVDVRTPVSSPTKTISWTEVVNSNPMLDSLESSMTGARDTSLQLIGRVNMERGTADIDRDVNKLILLSVSAAIIFWLTVSLLSFLVLRRVTRSFHALMLGIENIQAGDLSTRIEVESDDEPGRAAQAVNHLAIALKESSEENLRLQEERLNLEREILQAQKLESLGIMAGGVAHDFNNMLQSILGNMEMALMNLTPGSDSKKLIENAMKSGKQAAQLTGLILAYTGRGFITRKELNLNALIRDNAEILKTAASSAVSLETSLNEELPAIKADEASIQQVVMNLVINGAESIEGNPGFVRITTEVRNCDQTYIAKSRLDVKPEPGRFVCLEVSDNGCGMSEETMKRIFDPFFTTKFTGRGLGMSAVMGIVKTHGGAILVESEPGMGSTFKILLPVPESAGPAEAEPSSTPPETEGVKTGLSGLVLVVDDEKNVLKTCSRMVKLCGLDVITACDGIDALSKFRERADEIDVVLMDLTMPNMNGIEAMGEIYGIRGDARVILSSGFNKEELIGQISGQLPSGFMRKPYCMSELEAEMRRVMQGE